MNHAFRRAHYAQPETGMQPPMRGGRGAELEVSVDEATGFDSIFLINFTLSSSREWVSDFVFECDEFVFIISACWLLVSS